LLRYMPYMIWKKYFAKPSRTFFHFL
jgi:hypothetical protein